MATKIDTIYDHLIKIINNRMPSLTCEYRGIDKESIVSHIGHIALQRGNLNYALVIGSDNVVRLWDNGNGTIECLTPLSDPNAFDMIMDAVRSAFTKV